MTKMCECGCGNPAPLARSTDTKKGYRKGEPTRFILGHSSRTLTDYEKKLRGRSREASKLWRGGRRYHAGYVMINAGREHPMADKDGYVSEHRLVMSEHLGRVLDSVELVHHKNKVKDDNRLENLLLTNSSEHRTIHNELDPMPRDPQTGRFCGRPRKIHEECR